MRKNLIPQNRRKESGMSMIELLIACAVLVFGLLSVMGVLMVATGNNGRSKIDSSATMLTQAVVEQISAVLEGGGPGSITDCAGGGTTWAIDTTAGAPPNGWGATLNGSQIDFTQATPPAGSHMDYVECNGNIQTTYDVRWNVQTVGSSNTFLVTVGAKPKAGLPDRFGFAIPVNMRVYVGQD
jgi:type II secretory pathway pseudopilin PulG